MCIRDSLQRYRLLGQVQQLKKKLLTYESDRLIGRSDKTKEIINLINKIATSDGSVLIRGESGVGKEVVARLVHENSPRSSKPFVAVNCASISESTLESEIFGHEKGAFTGAEKRRIGLIESAADGTIFLDEIAETSVGFQAKLLRVLQEKSFFRVGSSDLVHVNVRVVAATNKNLEQAIQGKEFREDLYYRLNVLNIDVPPLRERIEDIRELADLFLDKSHSKMGGESKRFSEEAVALLEAYNWPGNVRELQNIVERAFVLADSIEISSKLVRPWLNLSASTVADIDDDANLDFAYRTAHTQLRIVALALAKTVGKKDEARTLLGFDDRSTMRRTIQRLRERYPSIWKEFPILEKVYPSKVSDE